MSSRVITQLIFAAFWFTSAYAAMTALLPNECAWRCAWFNLIIGLVSLLLVTRSELGDRLFYKGPKGDERGSWLIGILWFIPVIIFFLAVIWWIARLVGFYNW